MKRSKTSSRAMRRRTTNDAASTGKKSRYARKLDAGRQLYGGRGAASCCGNESYAVRTKPSPLPCPGIHWNKKTEREALRA